jgi:hypothetical protein
LRKGGNEYGQMGYGDRYNKMQRLLRLFHSLQR